MVYGVVLPSHISAIFGFSLFLKTNMMSYSKNINRVYHILWLIWLYSCSPLVEWDSFRSRSAWQCGQIGLGTWHGRTLFRDLNVTMSQYYEVSIAFAASCTESHTWLKGKSTGNPWYFFRGISRTKTLKTVLFWGFLRQKTYRQRTKNMTLRSFFSRSLPLVSPKSILRSPCGNLTCWHGKNTKFIPWFIGKSSCLSAMSTRWCPPSYVNWFIKPIN